MAVKSKNQEKAEAAAEEPAKKRPPPANAFQKGQSGNPGGKKKPKPEEPDGLSDAGRMRRVLEQAPAADCNSAQRALRAVYDKNPLGFIKLVTELERAERSVPAAGEGKPLAADAGEERVLRLIGELLDEAGRRAGS